MAKKKNTSDIFDEAEPTSKSQDFEALFEKSLSTTTRRLNVGDQLQSEILSIGKTEAFVSTGTPIDAVILTADLLDERKELKFKVGDKIDISIVRVTPEEVRATRKGAKGAPTEIDNLEDAFDMELPVEGKVTEVVNGGYRVSVHGQPAFCPISQLDSKPIPDPSSMVGKKFEFLITQFEPKRRNIVVSRRRLLDARKVEAEGLWMQEHNVGDIVDGLVTRTETYGAFVEVSEGVEGLVHVSEIGFVRLKHAADGVSVGAPVKVKILKIEEEDSRLRISLSIKQGGGSADPWIQIPMKYPVGTVFEGTVEKKEAFGIFVTIIPGITGLLPKSKWRDAVDSKPYERAKPGDRFKVQVDEIKFEERKISLGVPSGDGEDDSWREHQTSAPAGLGALAAAFSKAKRDS